MSPVKLAIVYYSSTGTIYQLATSMKQAAEEAGAEVRLRQVPELAPAEAIAQVPAWRKHLDATRHIPQATNADLEWADAFLFGTPTRYGTIASQLKQFIDGTGPSWFQGKLSNKVAAGFTSASNPHGGQEVTLLSLATVFMHWGCLIVPPGYTDQAVYAAGGNPYGASITSQPERPLPATSTEAARYLARRVVLAAEWVHGAREVLR